MSSSPSTEPTANQPNGAQEIILVVEDSAYMRDLIAGHILPSLGFTARTAKTIAEGAAMLLNEPPDLLLADWQLPDGEGLELLRLIRDYQLDIPAILMTAHGSERIAVEAFRLGARNYLSKPFKLDEAAYALSQALSERRLRRERDRLTHNLQQLFSGANDLIFSLDADLCLQTANHAVELVLGRSSAELRGVALANLCTPSSWAQARGQFYALLAEQSVPPFELELRCSQGEIAYLEVSAQKTVFDGRQTLLCIARNLTERRRLERRLVQSEKLSAIGQLVAGVAHELNNPLTSVSGYAQLLLRDRTLPAETLQDLEQIHLQATRAARIVQNLLLFARERHPERTTVDLNEVLRSTLALQRYQLKVETIEVFEDLDSDLPTTIADPHQLQQVFLNLIINARQAMAEQSGLRRLTVRSRLIPGAPRIVDDGSPQLSDAMLEVLIGDTGAGISSENLVKIFDPFFTTKPVGQGTGLGLSICYGIVQEHGGAIWAESRLKAGTNFFVRLPLVVPPHSQPSTLPDEQPPLRAVHILVVDDEEPVGNIITRLLHDLGHQALAVSSVETALEAIRREHFDLLLSDVRMPGLSGIDLHRILRDLGHPLARAMIFVTGDTVSVQTREQLAQTGSLYLAKPFSLEQLADALSRTLRDRDRS